MVFVSKDETPALFSFCRAIISSQNKILVLKKFSDTSCGATRSFTFPSHLPSHHDHDEEERTFISLSVCSISRTGDFLRNNISFTSPSHPHRSEEKTKLISHSVCSIQRTGKFRRKQYLIHIYTFTLS